MFGSDRKECAASDGSLSPVKSGGSYQCSPEQNAPVTVPTTRAAAEGKCPFEIKIKGEREVEPCFTKYPTLHSKITVVQSSSCSALPSSPK